MGRTVSEELLLGMRKRFWGLCVVKADSADELSTAETRHSVMVKMGLGLALWESAHSV